MARQNGKTRAKGAASLGAAAPIGSGEQIRQTLEDTGAHLHDKVEAGSRQFAAIGEQAFDVWLRGGSEAMERVLELNVEVAAWSREQLDDSIEAVRSLSQCRSVGDAYGIQVGLMQSSMEKSLRHGTNIVNLVTHAMLAGAQTGARFQRPG